MLKLVSQTSPEQTLFLLSAEGRVCVIRSDLTESWESEQHMGL